MGGSELLAYQLFDRLDKDLLKRFQIVLSRKRELDESKIRLFYCHDLPKDPESQFLKDPKNHDLFHKYIFVSNWQMQAYINYYSLPWNKCIVIQNAIEPIPEHTKPDFKKQVNMVYFSTPQRGLDLLVPVFDALSKKHDNIHLHVFSSFEIYGWPDRDKQYADLFDQIKGHDKMTYYGTVKNEEIREHLKDMHILAYPSTWPETSCLTLLEAMSAQLLCIHSNLAALFETSANWNMMYQFLEDKNQHARTFYTVLEAALENYTTKNTENRLKTMKAYTDMFYDWNQRIIQWNAFLKSMDAGIKDTSFPKIKENILSFDTSARR
jgi:glycosyltransferase involved in cell wall biosynthesis